MCTCARADCEAKEPAVVGPSQSSLMPEGWTTITIAVRRSVGRAGDGPLEHSKTLCPDHGAALERWFADDDS